MFAAVDLRQLAEMTAPVKDFVLVDSLPYIRPLAELQDEYENEVVVVAGSRSSDTNM